MSHLNQGSHLVLFKANGKKFLRQTETSVTQIVVQRNKEIKTGSQLSINTSCHGLESGSVTVTKKPQTVTCSPVIDSTCDLGPSDSTDSEGY